jgi:threonine dehydrogenase-like Zn-dependent dehydrogenase
MEKMFKGEQKEIQLEGSGATWSGHWVPRDAPSQVLHWGVKTLAKVGTFSIIGVYPETMTRFPIGMAMLKNLTLQMGNCPHRRYIPQLIETVQQGKVDRLKVLTQVKPMTDAIEAYKAFDKRKAGWVKVELRPVA